MSGEVPNASRSRQDQARGRHLQSVAVALGVAGAVGLLVIIAAFEIELGKGFGSAVVGLLSFALLVSCSVIYDSGKRHLQPTAKQALAADARPPVVYLRSFDTEDAVSVEERVLAGIMREVGPFVAIGRPEDRVPPLGAARHYLPKGPWKPTVRELLDRAQLVILVSGQTEGLAWELGEVMRRMDHDRVAILVTADRAAYAALEDRLRASADATLPEFPDLRKLRNRAGQFVGVIRFDAAWTGTFEGFEKAAWVGKGHELRDAGTALEDRLRLALVKTRVGRESIRKPTTNWLKIGFASYVAMLFVVLLIAVVLGLSGALGPM